MDNLKMKALYMIHQTVLKSSVETETNNTNM
jgi:hypothetical protein